MTSAGRLRPLFLLDPSVTFLNHGSFGACPKPVFEVYQGWQRELEHQPVEFLARRHDALLAEARSSLVAYVNAAPEDLAFITNATAGINIVAQSLALAPGDEVLTTDHEYGALDYAWTYYCEQANACYMRQPLPLPIPDGFDFADWLWQGVTPHTRVIFLSHITSPTALIFPIAEVIRRAREAGIITVIDGAHAPGHIPLDLTALDPDFYAGNCHKWLCAPKGSAFLYARRDRQRGLRPAWISWGWSDTNPYSRRIEQQGTRDLAAFLSVPAAIAFQAEQRWDEVRADCHQLARDTRAKLADLTGLAPLMPDDGWYGQMFTAALPPCDPEAVKQRLYDEYRVEVPVFNWNGQPYIRASFQGYNDAGDAARFLSAVADVCKR